MTDPVSGVDDDCSGLSIVSVVVCDTEVAVPVDGVEVLPGVLVFGGDTCDADENDFVIDCT